MNKIRYAVIVLLSVTSFVTMAMNPKKQAQVLRGKLELALSESKKESRAKAARGEYVTPRSAERTQRLSIQQSPISVLMPAYRTEKTTSCDSKSSQSTHVTTRKKTPRISITAKPLYDAAMKLPEKSTKKSRLDQNLSIAQKIGFDASIKRGDVDSAVKFLNANNGLKTSYPLAIKLYAVMTSQTDKLEIHPNEAAIIPVRDICRMAKSLATFGYNEEFLEKYARIVHHDPEMRKIIDGD